MTKGFGINNAHNKKPITYEQYIRKVKSLLHRGLIKKAKSLIAKYPEYMRKYNDEIAIPSTIKGTGLKLERVASHGRIGEFKVVKDD